MPCVIEGYEITERTRFRVRYEINAGRDFAAPGTYWLTNMMSLEDCQRAYIEAREQSGLGASQFGSGELFDEMGQHLAHVSYNGRLWPPVSWHPDLKVNQATTLKAVIQASLVPGLASGAP